MTAGLYQLAAHQRQQAEWNRAKAKSTSADPRIAHECEQAALRLEAEAATHDAHAAENENLILAVETLIAGVLASPYGGQHRMLALQHLEAASMRMQRENGKKPCPTN